MKRYAAHFIFPSLLSSTPGLHYAELSQQNQLLGIYPLEKELASVAFYSGILFFCRLSQALSGEALLQHFYQEQLAHPHYTAFDVLKESPYILQQVVGLDYPVSVFLIEGLDLSSPQFCTHHGSSRGHIQRL